jgi:multicomponent Na+:H+ antiporter subunit A
VPGLDVALDFRLDGFGLVMALLVAGVGLLVCLWSVPYLQGRDDLHRFAGWLTLFAGAMLGLVLADNVFALYLCWELTSVTSYLLIGFDDDRAEARAAALRALLVTSAGGLALLGGLVVLGNAAGTFTLSGLAAHPPAGPAAGVGCALVLLGILTKSAQLPFAGWLPAAMVAPTPVSAYLHAAAMVKAGVYLTARLAPVLEASGWAAGVATGIGLASMLWGGWIALRRTDLKQLLAYGTISQLGFLILLLATGEPELRRAGIVLLAAHAIFKAALFMVTGVVEHQAGTRELGELHGLGRRLPALAAIGGLAAASMAGVAPLLGFVAKEGAYEALLHDPPLLAGAVAGSVLTVAYSARWWWGAFAAKGKAEPSPAEVEAPGSAMVAPPAVLAGLGVVLGVAPGAVLGPLVDPAAPGTPLALWHGLTPALGLSGLTLAAGAAVFVLAGRRTAAAGASGERVWRAGLGGLAWVATRLTGLVQNGSLPAYLTVVLLAVLALPGAALAGGLAGLPGAKVAWADAPLQVAVAVLVAVAAVGAALAGRRLAAVLLVGAVGYGVAVLYVVQGAPDLALTQFLIETLTLVVFGLILRRLPGRFPARRSRLGQVVRIAVAGAVGVLVTVFALVAPAVRTAPPIAGGFLERALSEGGGANVVNVIIVDFRGFDTLGEITVLAVAALGFVSLLLVGARKGHDDDRGPE